MQEFPHGPGSGRGERIRTYNTCAGYRYVRSRPDWDTSENLCRKLYLQKLQPCFPKNYLIDLECLQF
ncbi:MAG TPA: hypothetical protein EYO84_10280, partial [Planctomycetes bacterium]|nr:hypothetical protein [Planctomycetota bacterium]